MNHKRSATALVALLVLATSAAMGVVATTDAASTSTNTGLDGFDAAPSTTHSTTMASPNHTGTDKVARLLEEFDLTENETTAIVDELAAMHADGASRADVHHALHYLLYQHGYDAETVHAEAASARLEVRFGLADDRADELGTDIVDMRQDGASRQEVRQHVAETLESWGVDVGPDRPDAAERLDRALDHLQDRYDLTDDEVAELRDLAVEMHDDGATRMEIKHALVHEARELGDTDARRGW